MANRATDADVEELVEVDEDVSLTPFINAANQLVTELCTDSGYTDDRLTMIETWLSAHMYQMRDQAVDTEKADVVTTRYQYTIGLMLQQTKYGQTAMMLDTAGNLATLSKQMEQGERAEVSLFWPGENYDTEDEDD